MERTRKREPRRWYQNSATHDLERLGPLSSCVFASFVVLEGGRGWRSGERPKNYNLFARFLCVLLMFRTDKRNNKKVTEACVG